MWKITRDSPHLALLVPVASLCFAVACDRSAAQSDGSPKAPAPAGHAAPATVPHGNHDAKYGGVVLMNGDLHFEVVLRADGRHQVYFSDAMRDELPASVASSVSVTVTRAGAPAETIPLQIDESGESWIGRGRTVDDPVHTSARIGFAADGKPYWIDVPFAR